MKSSSDTEKVTSALEARLSRDPRPVFRSTAAGDEHHHQQSLVFSRITFFNRDAFTGRVKSFKYVGMCVCVVCVCWCVVYVGVCVVCVCVWCMLVCVCVVYVGVCGAVWSVYRSTHRSVGQRRAAAGTSLTINTICVHTRSEQTR